MKKNTLVYIKILILSYLLISFIKLDLNFFNWEYDDRVGFVIISNLTFVFYLICSFIINIDE